MKKLELSNRQVDELRWAACGLELVENGLRSSGAKDTDDPGTCCAELWNARMARRTINRIIGRWNPKTKRWVKR